MFLALSMAMIMSEYHVPVLLIPSIEGLNLKEGGIYVDVTFGGGGHSREILKRLKGGRLIGFDQDEDAKANAIDDKRFELVDQNFRFLKNNLRVRGITKVDGVLADLGVSSHQFNEGERGFSIRFDAPLDMRMDKTAAKTAAQVVNTWEEFDLAKLFFENGELSNSRKIASVLVAKRAESPIETTGQLMKCLKHLSPARKQHQFYAKVFQALRIEVNDEIEAFKELLKQSEQVLSEGGRLVVISYHSLEDRLMKHFSRFGNFEGEAEKDFYGNLIRPMKPITNKPIVPTAQEIEINNRARNARLRIAEKL
jgi:16S rRNA (cytosine1402-N4)-methyltransferase